MEKNNPKRFHVQSVLGNSNQNRTLRYKKYLTVFKWQPICGKKSHNKDSRQFMDLGKVSNTNEGNYI